MIFVSIVVRKKYLTMKKIVAKQRMMLPESRRSLRLIRIAMIIKCNESSLSLCQKKAKDPRPCCCRVLFSGYHPKDTTS
jgi:hypothetical protein